MKFGDVVKDRISGFSGVLTARTEYDNGCIKWSVTPQKLDKDSKPAETQWFDQQYLENESSVKAGGPMPLAPVR